MPDEHYVYIRVSVHVYTATSRSSVKFIYMAFTHLFKLNLLLVLLNLGDLLHILCVVFCGMDSLQIFWYNQ